MGGGGKGRKSLVIFARWVSQWQPGGCVDDEGGNAGSRPDGRARMT